MSERLAERASGARPGHKALLMRQIGVSYQLCRILFNSPDIEQRDEIERAVSGVGKKRNLLGPTLAAVEEKYGPVD